MLWLDRKTGWKTHLLRLPLLITQQLVSQQSDCTFWILVASNHSSSRPCDDPIRGSRLEYGDVTCHPTRSVRSGPIGFSLERRCPWRCHPVISFQSADSPSRPQLTIKYTVPSNATFLPGMYFWGLWGNDSIDVSRSVIDGREVI